MADAVRRSGRARVPSRRYIDTEDDFQRVEDMLAEDDSEFENGSLERGSTEEEDHEYSANAETHDPDLDLVELDSNSEVSDGTDLATPSEEHDESHTSHTGANPKAYRQGLSAKQSHQVVTNHATRSRGLPEHYFKDHANRIDLLGGHAADEKLNLQKSRNQWITDPCLPIGQNMRHCFAHRDNEKTMEAKEGWDWYFNQGAKDVFAKKQSMAPVDVEARTKYLTGFSQELVMGPYGNQKISNIAHLQALPMDDYLDESPSNSIEEHELNGLGKARHEWMLNVGNAIQCLDWAPNCNDRSQYLALATAHTSDRSLKEHPKSAPAFNPGPATKSSIQLWAFALSSVLETTSSSYQKYAAPTLKQVLCSDWGAVKQMEWCPMPRDGGLRDTLGKTSIGLLAGIWGDGCTRVLDVQVDDEAEDPTVYWKIDSAAFATTPINVVCTCLCWLSATDLAIGHSDGSISIYDICSELDENSASVFTLATMAAVDSDNSQRAPTPYISIPDPLSTFSPILTLTSAYPTHPTLLATSSISGYERLLDLRAPKTDYVLGPRTRSPATNLVYSPDLLSFILNDDSDGTIRSSALRYWGVDRIRFGRTFRAGKCDNYRSGPLGRRCLDIGKVHCSVAWGTADGSVFVGNPVTAVLGPKKGRKQHWQVCVCRLEWIQKRRPEATNVSGLRSHDAETVDPLGTMQVDDARDENGEMKAPGRSRITQSYKAEKMEFVRGRIEKPSYATIYEEENAVTAVRWNRNLSCGGWLAVGWGCGLVKVADVAI